MYALDAIYGLFEPWIFLGLSAAYLPSTIFNLIKAGEWSSFTSFDQFSFAWFANLWSFAGPLVRQGAEPRVVPLLEGRVQAGSIIKSPSATDVNDLDLPVGVGGTVIEIGPGSGMWASIFSDNYISDAGHKSSKGQRTRVDKVYGVEPNSDHHPALRQRVRDAGLQGRYEVVPVGIEDIGTSGLIDKGSVDAIVTVLCLCSIPDPEKNIRELYQYLKPGGRWFVYEHVQCHASQGSVMTAYQKFLNLLWPSFMGGCDLCRDTAKSLHDAGSWERFDLAMPVDEPWWATTPHIYGILTK